jgi:hypothetical protein
VHLFKPSEPSRKWLLKRTSISAQTGLQRVRSPTTCSYIRDPVTVTVYGPKFRLLLGTECHEASSSSRHLREHARQRAQPRPCFHRLGTLRTRCTHGTKILQSGAETQLPPGSFVKTSDTLVCARCRSDGAAMSYVRLQTMAVSTVFALQLFLRLGLLSPVHI